MLPTTTAAVAPLLSQTQGGEGARVGEKEGHAGLETLVEHDDCTTWWCLLANVQQSGICYRVLL